MGWGWGALPLRPRQAPAPSFPQSPRPASPLSAAEQTTHARPPPSESPPPTVHSPAPGSSHPSAHRPAPGPLAPFWAQDFAPESPLLPPSQPAFAGLPEAPRGPSPRPLTWRRVVQLAVVGPPAGAGGLPDEERARHGGQSSRGSPVRTGVAKHSTREAVPLRSEWRRATNSFKYSSLWRGVVEGGHAPLSPRRQSRRAFAGGHAPSRCAGAGGARAAWRWGPGGGRSEARPRALLRSPRGGLPGAGTGSPRRGGTPFGTPRARLPSDARSSASGAPWRRQPRVWAPDVPKPPPPQAWGGGGNFLGQAGASQRAWDSRSTIHISGEAARK